jgi:hypothetical protein
VIAAALVLFAFVALCVGCVIFEALTRPTLDRIIEEALAPEPDYDAGIAAMDRLGKSANR